MFHRRNRTPTRRRLCRISRQRPTRPKPRSSRKLRPGQVEAESKPTGQVDGGKSKSSGGVGAILRRSRVVFSCFIMCRWLLAVRRWPTTESECTTTNLIGSGIEIVDRNPRTRICKIKFADKICGSHSPELGNSSPDQKDLRL